MPKRPRRRRDLGRTLARGVIAVLALVGALPLVLVLSLKTPWARAEAAAIATKMLADDFGVTASFEAELRALPPAIVVRNLFIPSNDGGPPVAAIDRVQVVPRPFALLAGRIDAGDVEVDRPRLRVVLDGDRVKNLAYRALGGTPPSKPSVEAPFRTLSITQASLDVTLVAFQTRAIIDDLDVDLSADTGPTFDATLRLGSARVERTRTTGGSNVSDEDVICGLSARLHSEGGTLLVRRLELAARLDADAAPGTAPSCESPPSRESEVKLAVALLRVAPGPAILPTVSGHVAVTLPLRVLNRALPSAPAFDGDVTLDVDVAYSGLRELPSVRGRIDAHEVVLFHQRTIAHELTGTLDVVPEEVRLVSAHVAYAGGEVVLKNAKIAPLAPGIPVDVELVELHALRFPALMRDVGITKHTLVEWTFDSGTIRGFKGLVADPQKKGPSMIGDVVVSASNLEIGSKGWDQPGRQHVVGVKKALARGRFGIEPYGVVFRNMIADFGQSHADVPSVIVGFHEMLEVRIAPATRIDLAEISPLATVRLSGKLEVDGLVHGGQSHPRIDGDLKATGFRLGDLPLADALTAHAEFQPYVVDFTKLRAQKGKSAFEASLVRLDLDRPEGVAVDAELSAKQIDARDGLAMFLYDQDPRFEDIHGKGDARVSVRFENGGPRDACRTGVIDIRAAAEVGPMHLFGETYDGGNVELDYHWFDRAAQERGVDATIRSASLRKGRGTILAAATIKKGGVLRGHFVASDIPLAQVESLAELGRLVDGSVSGAGEISGTLDAIAATASLTLSPLRIGQKQLPSSALTVRLVPTPRRETPGRKQSACGEEIPAPFDRREWERDEPAGVFHVSGTMFGGQLALDDVTTTRQTHKLVTGRVTLASLDLGAIAQLAPAIALSDAPPSGKMSGVLDVARYEVDRPSLARLTLELDDAEVSRSGMRARIHAPKEGEAKIAIKLEGDALTATPLAVDITTPTGVTAAFALKGAVRHLTTTRELDLEAHLGPIDIAAILSLFPRVENAAGKLEAHLAITGRASAPIARGDLRLTQGEVTVRGMPVTLDGIEVAAHIDEREIRVVSATARAGGGKVSITGRAPLKGLEIGEMTGHLEAEGVRLPLAPGVEMAVDAQLNATSKPAAEGTRRKLALGGDVTLASFLYTRPIAISASFDTLAKQGRRTTVAVYDPDDDFVYLDIALHARAPLRFRNNLLEAEVVPEGDLVITGTNQRFGMRGQLRVVKGGRLRLRANEFDIRQGTIRFDDPTRIAPRVDLFATTDYRRYTTSSAAPTTGAAASAGSGAAAGAGRAGGSWRITLHAHGDADDLKLDLTSEPNLAQDDIVLLLAIGMTRAELDQLQAANLGSTAALEALSALSGADSAVKQAIPIIDDFRFGSAYSVRTGRTEPTVTVGKRLSDRVRASVITGLAENRDVRSNVEWRLSPQTSVLGNYDNLNDVTSQGLGNLGVDYRIRLEF